MTTVYFFLNQFTAACRFGDFLSFVLTLSYCHRLQQCQLPRHVHMRISLSLMPTVQRCSSRLLCSKQSLSSGWVLLIYYSCICLEGGEDCQELIRVCIVIHIYLSFQHTSNVRLLLCTLKASHATSLLCRGVISPEGAASTVCVVMWLHHPHSMDGMFLALHWLLAGCWAPVRVGPCVLEPCLSVFILIVSSLPVGLLISLYLVYTMTAKMIALFYLEAFCILSISPVPSKTFLLYFICDQNFAHPSCRMCLFLWSICLSKLQQLLLACAAQKRPRVLPKGCCTSKEKLQAQSSQKPGACGAQSPKGGCWHGCKRKSSFQGAALEFPSVGEHWALQEQGSKPGSSMQIVKIFPEA